MKQNLSLLLLITISFILYIPSVTAQKTTTAIGFATSNMYATYPNSALGNFITDAIKYEVENNIHERIDVVLLTKNTIRGTIYKGEIYDSTIDKIAPFHDSLFILNIQGGKLKSLLDIHIKKGGCYVSGMQIKITNMTAEKILIDNQPIDSNTVYKIVTTANSFYHNPLSKYYMEVEKKDTQITINQLIKSYIAELTYNAKAISAYPQSRISY